MCHYTPTLDALQLGTCWNLFDESQAREALTLAEEALAIAQRLVQQFTAGAQE
ncbi:MAG: hypothetical protein NZ699_06470 [Roseiflexus sp.]|nr:hypothetical protein [Roseiflexus sp.]MDW8147303.1 hypothetical protein [Roseiflexaceae bacterium]